MLVFFFFQAEDGIRDIGVTGVQTCALPILPAAGFRGINVTIPHKQAALALADAASPVATAVGAANTLTFERSGAIHADNTDVPGLLEALPGDPAERLVAELGGRVVDAPEAAALLVNCTSVGLREADAPFKSLPIRADTFGVGNYVADMVYAPGGTRLLAEAKRHGATVVTGLQILIAQGAASFERWTGMTA